MPPASSSKIVWLWIRLSFLKALAAFPFWSRKRRGKFARSIDKRTRRLNNMIGGRVVTGSFDPSAVDWGEQGAGPAGTPLPWTRPDQFVRVGDQSFRMDRTIRPEGAPGQILIVCQHAPTINHAGGLRILDMIQLIRSRHQHCYIELFTSANHSLYGALGEASILVDRIVVAEDYNFSLLEYLRRTEKPRFFDVIDFQFPQPPELIAAYRGIGRKLIFTPMESHIRNEFLERGIDPVSVDALTSPNAREEAEICRIVDQTVCVSERDRAAIAACLGKDADVVAIETGVSDIEFSGTITPVDPDDHAVCYVAYFGSETNRQSLLWYLEKVHPLVRAAVPDYEFRIIGRGDISDILADAPEGVRHVGEVPRIAPHVKGTVIGIAPALSGSGFRGKINQYAHLGLPTVATTLSADGLAYEDGVSILVSDDPAEFGAHVIRLLQDTGFRAAMAAAAAETCRTAYGWDAKWPQITQVYDLPEETGVARLPTIHAVVPSYQHAPYIEERLRSIFAQHYPGIRVTVIDDHSSDGSHEVIERLREDFDFTYIRRDAQSGSPFSTWQYAAENTTEDLIWICESDDSCSPFMVGTLVRHMLQRRRAGIAYCAALVMNEKGEFTGSTIDYHSANFDPVRWRQPFMSHGLHELRDYQRLGMVVPNMSGCLIDADLFRTAFDARVKSYKLAGDWLFIGQAMQHTDVVYVSEALNHFRKHPQTARSRTSEIRRTAEHVSVRLTLSRLAGASDREVLEAVKYDLVGLFGDETHSTKVVEEMRQIDPEGAAAFVDLLSKHCSGRKPSAELEQSLKPAAEAASPNRVTSDEVLR